MPNFSRKSKIRTAVDGQAGTVRGVLARPSDPHDLRETHCRYCQHTVWEQIPGVYWLECERCNRPWYRKD